MPSVLGIPPWYSLYVRTAPPPSRAARPYTEQAALPVFSAQAGMRAADPEGGGGAAGRPVADRSAATSAAEPSAAKAVERVRETFIRRRSRKCVR